MWDPHTSLREGRLFVCIATRANVNQVSIYYTVSDREGILAVMNLGEH